MLVQVFSGSVLVEEREFSTEAAAQRFADYWQDEGYRVRMNELELV